MEIFLIGALTPILLQKVAFLGGEVVGWKLWELNSGFASCWILFFRICVHISGVLKGELGFELKRVCANLVIDSDLRE